MKTVSKTACTKIAGMFLGNRSEQWRSVAQWRMDFRFQRFIQWYIYIYVYHSVCTSADKVLNSGTRASSVNIYILIIKITTPRL